MPELGSDNGDRLSVGYQLGGQRVEQSVWVDPLVNAGLRRLALEHHRHVLTAERLASVIAGDDSEQHATTDPSRLPRIGPPLDRGHGAGPEADRARLGALAAQNPDGPAVRVNIGGFERERFGDTEAATVEHRHQGPVPLVGHPTGTG